MLVITDEVESLACFRR